MTATVEVLSRISPPRGTQGVDIPYSAFLL